MVERGVDRRVLAGIWAAGVVAGLASVLSGRRLLVGREPMT